MKGSKKRLDLLLVERGLVESRSKAQAVILAGQVSVLPPAPSALKPGTLLIEDCKITLHSLPRYVSRGGEKLEAALDHWGVAARGKACLDIGSSTGGFTECLLQRGARLVWAVDVGYGQIHPKLRADPRVRLFEETHILKWIPPWIDKSPDSDYKEGDVPVLATADVSFISLEKVLKRAYEILGPEADLLALVKPQFEVGQRHLKKGIVKSEEARSSAVEKITAAARDAGFSVAGHFPCPVLGAKGNREEWLFLNKRKIS